MQLRQNNCDALVFAGFTLKTARASAHVSLQ